MKINYTEYTKNDELILQALYEQLFQAIKKIQKFIPNDPDVLLAYLKINDACKDFCKAMMDYHDKKTNGDSDETKPSNHNTRKTDC